MNPEQSELGMSGRRHNGDRSPDEIEADIDYTRARMDADLAALEDRLSPGHLIDEALRQIRSGGAAEYFRNLGETAKRNPMPLALVSTGLAWLALSSRAGSAGAYSPGSADYGYEGAWHGEYAESSSASSTAEDMKAKAGQAWERTAGSASAAVQSAKDRAHRMTDSARHGMDTAREQARRRAEQARAGARRVTGFMYEQPLVAAGVALTVGAVLGGLLPSTRREDELMGRRSDALTGSIKRETESLLREGEQRLRSATGADAGDARRQTRQTSVSSSDTPSSVPSSSESRPGYTPPLGESAASAGGSLLPEEDLTIGEERGARVTQGATEADCGDTASGGTKPGSGSRGKQR